MSKLPRLSGKDVAKVFCNHFHFRIMNRTGSHMVLINEAVRPPTLLTVVMHKEIRQGTLTDIVHRSGVSREAFLEAVNT